MTHAPDEPRREFLKQGLALGLTLAAGQGFRPARLVGDALDPDPEVPNEQVARILRDLFGDRPIRRGQVMLDMPVVAVSPGVRPSVRVGARIPTFGMTNVSAKMSFWFLSQSLTTNA